MSPAETSDARIAVVIPCYNDGDLVGETIDSISEDEPVELVVVDDASPDEHTREVLADLASNGTRVVRHEQNRGLGAARTTGVRSTSAPYVFPLDSDDMAVPGAIGRLADLLESDESAVVAYGDYQEFGDVDLVRPVPSRVDPFRIAYTNEYPVTSLYRRVHGHPAG